MPSSTGADGSPLNSGPRRPACLTARRLPATAGASARSIGSLAVGSCSNDVVWSTGSRALSTRSMVPVSRSRAGSAASVAATSTFGWFSRDAVSTETSAGTGALRRPTYGVAAVPEDADGVDRDVGHPATGGTRGRRAQPRVLRLSTVTSHESRSPQADDKNSAHDYNGCPRGPEIGARRICGTSRSLVVTLRPCRQAGPQRGAGAAERGGHRCRLRDAGHEVVLLAAGSSRSSCSGSRRDPALVAARAPGLRCRESVLRRRLLRRPDLCGQGLPSWT